MLKWLALVLMVVDHFGYIFEEFISPDLYLTMRTLGRLSFPIFVYYVTLGMGRTSNLKKYMIRLLLFAVISEVIIRYFLMFDNIYVNVIFSFVLYGLVYILLENRLNIKVKEMNYILLLPLIILTPYVEYGYSGLLIFLSLYLINKEASEKFKPFFSAVAIILSFLIGILLFNGISISLFAGISGLMMFNSKLDKRIFNKKFEKWSFYIFYPLQWLIFGIIYSLMT